MRSGASESVSVPIVAILLFEAFALVARSYLRIKLVEDGQTAALANNLSYLIAPPILVILMFPILRQHRNFLVTRFNPARLTMKTVGIAILVGILLRMAYWGHLIGFVALGIYRNNDPHAVVGPLVSFSCPPTASLLLHVLVMSLLVPLIEEVVNRGFLLYSLMHKGRTNAIVLSSILFAVFHSPMAMPNAFVIGLFFAVFALNSGSLWPPLVAHMTYNGLIALDWLCLQVQWNPQEVTSHSIGSGLLALLIAILTLFASARLVGQKCAGTDIVSQRTRQRTKMS